MLRNFVKEITIYHNPKCSTSRTVLKTLQENKYKVKIIDYLKSPLTKNEIKSLLELLNLQPSELLRKKEPLAKELNLIENGISESKVLTAMFENPILIERPVISDGTRAFIARPLADFLPKIETHKLF